MHLDSNYNKTYNNNILKNFDEDWELLKNIASGYKQYKDIPIPEYIKEPLKKIGGMQVIKSMNTDYDYKEKNLLKNKIKENINDTHS